jgi:hypothetical protein
MQVIPRYRLVGMPNCSLRGTSANGESNWLSELKLVETELPSRFRTSTKPFACRFGSASGGDHDDVL